MEQLPEKTYQHLLAGLKEKIRQARLKTVLAANAGMLAMYWEIGNTILQQQQAEGWGAKIIDNLLCIILKRHPTQNKFTRTDR